jgi:hypothetical protein
LIVAQEFIMSVSQSSKLARFPSAPRRDSIFGPLPDSDETQLLRIQANLEPFVDPDTAAHFLGTTRRHVLEMVRAGLIIGHPLDPNSKKKDWRFLLSELYTYMVSCEARPPGAPKPSKGV